jgi:uncharacterized protein
LGKTLVQISDIHVGSNSGCRGTGRIYISRGVGHLLHVRFNVRPEVTVFELCSA